MVWVYLAVALGFLLYKLQPKIKAYPKCHPAWVVAWFFIVSASVVACAGVLNQAANLLFPK